MPTRTAPPAADSFEPGLLARLADLIPDVRKIAVLRANALGDFIFTLPALQALRAAYPTAEIVLLGQRWHADFLAGRPGPVDRTVAVPPSHGVNDSAPPSPAAELERFFADMRRERFDLALQLHGGGRNSNPFVRQLGARVTVGARAPDAEPLDRWVRYVCFQPEIVRLLEVVALAGAAAVALEPRLTVTGRDLEESRGAVPDDGGPLAFFHPGAGDPKRRWPPEKFAAVGDALARAGARVLVGGVPHEAEAGRAVRAAMRHESFDLCGRLTLGGLAGLLSRCAVVVSNDSGPLHLAAAVGASTVGIYWCFNLLCCSELTRARHRAFVSWRLECPACGATCVGHRCEHPDSLVAETPEDEVAAAALELFAGERRTA